MRETRTEHEPDTRVMLTFGRIEQPESDRMTSAKTEVSCGEMADTVRLEKTSPLLPAGTWIPQACRWQESLNFLCASQRHCTWHVAHNTLISVLEQTQIKQEGGGGKNASLLTLGIVP